MQDEEEGEGKGKSESERDSWGEQRYVVLADCISTLTGLPRFFFLLSLRLPFEAHYLFFILSSILDVGVCGIMVDEDPLMMMMRY
jgi:hypothetical protein